MLLVLAEAFYKGEDRTALVGLAVAGSLAAAIASIVLYRQLGAGRDARPLLGDMLVADALGYVLSALFAVITALTALMSPRAPARARLADRRVLRRCCCCRRRAW